MSSEDEDDDDDDDDEVAIGVDWDVLEDEDTLTSGHPSVQGPFPFHAEGSESMRSVEAGESAASHGVPAEDRWVEESGPAAADPEATGEGSGSGAAPPEVSLPAPEQGVGSKRSRLDESGQGSRNPSLKRFRRPRTST